MVIDHNAKDINILFAKKCKYVANNKAIIFATKNALTHICKGIFLSVANKLQKFG